MDKSERAVFFPSIWLIDRLNNSLQSFVRILFKYIRIHMCVILLWEKLQKSVFKTILINLSEMMYIIFKICYKCIIANQNPNAKALIEWSSEIFKWMEKSELFSILS